MRSAFPITFAAVLVAREGHAAATDPWLLDDAKSIGHLSSDDDLAANRGWLAPIDGGVLGVSIGVGVARRVGPFGAELRWGADLVLQVPLDRFFASRVVVRSWPRLAAKESSMKKNRWGAVAVLPSALAFAGASAAKDKTKSIDAASSNVPAAPSPSIVVPPATSAAGVIIVAAPVAPAPLPKDALPKLVAAAWHAAGLDRDEALSDLASRARASALAPEVRLRAYRGVDVGARVYRTDDVADKATTNDAAQTFFEARLSWKLDRLVFADEEVALERIRLERIELKQKLATKVIELVLRFQRARRMANDPLLLDGEREEAAAAALESILALDVLTAGAASQLLVR